MKPYYDTLERLAALKASAQSWIGTPFCGNAMVKGAGVSCQTLSFALYMETGFLPPDFPFSRISPMSWSHAHKESLIEKCVDAHPEKFLDMTAARRPLPGDLLGFKMGKCVHHCGVMIEGDSFIHVFEKIRIKTIFSTMRDATFSTRLARIWRPIE